MFLNFAVLIFKPEDVEHVVDGIDQVADFIIAALFRPFRA